jgi:hypothetical protein
VGHQENCARTADARLQPFFFQGGEFGRFSPVVEKTVKMDGREVLKLPEGAPAVIQPAPLRKEDGVKTAAFLYPRGEEEKPGGDAP